MAEDVSRSSAFDADGKRVDLRDKLEGGALVFAHGIGEGVDPNAHLHREGPAGDVIGQLLRLAARVEEGLRIVLRFEELFGEAGEWLIHEDDPGACGIVDAIGAEAARGAVDLESVIYELLREERGLGRVGLRVGKHVGVGR